MKQYRLDGRVGDGQWQILCRSFRMQSGVIELEKPVVVPKGQPLELRFAAHDTLDIPALEYTATSIKDEPIVVTSLYLPPNEDGEKG